MKKYSKYFLLTMVVLLFFGSCRDSVKNEREKVNKWIYNQMKSLYFWNDKITNSPNYTPAPDQFFESLLYKYNKITAPDGDRFSWIESDYRKLLASLSGVTSSEIGFEYLPIRNSPDGVTPVKYLLLVTYPKKGTDAYYKGLKRGNFVIQIDGSEITSANASQLLRGTGQRSLTVADWVMNTSTNKEELKVINTIQVQMADNFAENPIYMDSVYHINGKNIGYLVYNFFARDKNDKSHDYDKQLMSTLEHLQNQGITEMVLDLRYNSGGAVTTAIGLASALVKNRTNDKIFGIAQYNPYVQKELEKEEGPNFNIDYFSDKMMDTTAFVANIPALNLNRVFVLTGHYTASASELVINGLKPHMNVILVGDTTYGKNVGSVTLYEKNNPKNMWGLQPIIVKYYNSNHQSDYTAGFVPDFLLDELAEFDLVDFGDTADPLLNKALTEIAGPIPSPVKQYMRMKQAVPDKKLMQTIKKEKQFILDEDRRGNAIRKMIYDSE